jgi:hypothetical protein
VAQAMVGEFVGRLEQQIPLMEIKLTDAYIDAGSSLEDIERLKANGIFRSIMGKWIDMRLDRIIEHVSSQSGPR